MKKLVSILCLIMFLLSFTACNENSLRDNKNENTKEIFNYGDKNKKTTTQTQKQKKIIYFETNGGNYIEPIEIGSQGITMPEPTKENYGFAGWYWNQELTQEVTYPFTPSGEVTVYAKWIKTKGTLKCQNTKLKNWDNYSSIQMYSITPNGFDLDELQKNGYYMKITATYNVYYRKDYDVLFDIGYFGAPKYETSISNSDLWGTYETDIKAPSSETKRTISLTASLADIKNNRIILTFSTDNIQNVIYFSDIIITYECYR